MKCELLAFELPISQRHNIVTLKRCCIQVLYLLIILQLRGLDDLWSILMSGLSSVVNALLLHLQCHTDSYTSGEYKRKLE